MQAKREKLLKGNITKLLFKFSAPAIIGMIVGALYNIVDTIMPIIGITQGFSTIVGFNYGAKLFSRVKKTLGVAILWTVIIAGFGFTIMMLFTAQVIGIFTNDPDFIAKGIFPLRVVIIFLPLAWIPMLVF